MEYQDYLLLSKRPYDTIWCKVIDYTKEVVSANCLNQSGNVRQRSFWTNQVNEMFVSTKNLKVWPNRTDSLGNIIYSQIDSLSRDSGEVQGIRPPPTVAIPTNTQLSGWHLQKAATNEFVAMGLMAGTALICIATVSSSPASVPVIAGIGLVFSLGFEIAAWSNIKKAGEFLQKPN